ncbi:MaoC family dehydratase [Verticiella sediminum]|uniref:MaoC family dehydratase n=1 Tax=Verticiella sediminum TaxID=1247510 RepID=A0A556ALZ7_9BURK|nr:MaoC family dehydratase [Verticiella sediminum]TSH93897.1 MaoC family dehydratase [Verticiella sediminum]
MRVFQSFTELEPLVGQEIAVSDWLTVDQDKINKFGEVTGDMQWIHVDVERAKAGPFKAPIAHGFLTLSLLPILTASAYRIDGGKMGVNYGLDKVRFPSPVPVDSKVRARFTLKEYKPLPDNGVQLTVVATVEREGGDKPVCVAESLVRRY